MSYQRLILVLSLCVVGLAALPSCGGGATVTPATTSAPEATSAPATATSPPSATSTPLAATSAPATATSAPAATPEPEGEEVTFEFVAELSSIEEIDDIDLLLHDVEGILGVEGDEKSITITYDPAVITVDELQQVLESIRYPVKPPES